MRIPALVVPLALLGLAGCSAGPDTYAAMTTGVGFGDYQRYLRERADTATSRAPYSVAPETSRPLLPPASMPATAPTTLDAVPLRPMPQAAAPAPLPAPAVTAPLAAPVITTAPLTAPGLATAPLAAPAAPLSPLAAPMAPSAPAPAGPTVQTASFGTTPAFDAGPSTNAAVSDEQDFAAVSARETIESDRERLARQRAQYQVIEVTSVPDAGQHAGPDIVAFALSVSHAPGTEVYRRMNPLRWSRWENACLQFRNQDAAQEAFLANGGPERDRENLDPDGDGYACWWDPTPLRQALASR